MGAFRTITRTAGDVLELTVMGEQESQPLDLNAAGGWERTYSCLLYTSDAADETSTV